MKHCEKCDKIYSDEDKFCKECGEKLTKLVEEKTKSELENKISEKKSESIFQKYLKRQWIVLAIMIFLFLVFIFSSVGNQRQELPPLKSSYIRITGSDWNGGTSCNLKTEKCNDFYDINTFSNCGRIKVELDIPYEIKNEILSKVNKNDLYKYDYGDPTMILCEIFIDGSEMRIGSPQLKDGYNSISLTRSLRILVDHEIEICCEGAWEFVTKGHGYNEVCKTTTLRKFCD